MNEYIQKWRRYFTRESLLSEIPRVQKDALVTNPDGSVVFRLDGIETPASWSDRAVRVAAQKYFLKEGAQSKDGRFERSVFEMVYGVAHTIAQSGFDQGYFATADDAFVFEEELAHLLIHQYGAFNSPVWFNVRLGHMYGVRGSGGNWAWNRETDAFTTTPDSYMRPQISACFIQEVNDNLVEEDGIWALWTKEARLFKLGSGSGVNVSRIREKDAPLTAGGTASGVMSFLPAGDAGAGGVKSGGTTRRAARMVCMDVDHPEIESFVKWKEREEWKAQVLIAAGCTGGMEGEAYTTVSGQNANNSVRVTDAFMTAVEDDATWDLTSRLDPMKVTKTIKARELWNSIAKAAWVCGCPGVQYDTTINAWHTTPNAGRIRASNPCCFTGDTLVDTSEGRIPFSRLEEMCANGERLPYAFAFDLDSRLPKLASITRAWRAGRTESLIEVRTERGITLRCTPEHRFLLHSGDYVQAKDLRSGDRLRKVARGENENRAGRRSINHRITDTAPNGCEYQSRWMWEQVHGPIPEGFEVHHRNEDPTDDRLSNFELLPQFDHRQEHAVGASNPRYLDVDTQRLHEVWEAVAASDHGKVSKIGTVSVARWNKYIRDHGLKGTVPMARGDGRIRGTDWKDFARSMEAAQAAANDRVASIVDISLDEAVVVYDLEVEGLHNFAVTSQDSESLHTLVVHNSEYMHLDNSACNLASLRLTKFLREDGSFNVEDYRAAVRTFTVAMDILVDLGSYPSKEIARGAHRYRQLGLGYADLGALLMLKGVAYDSDAGRAFAAGLTSLMTAEAYFTSGCLAEAHGPFEGYAADKDGMLGVLAKHQTAHRHLQASSTDLFPVGDQEILTAGAAAWHEARSQATEHGVRNAQASVLAPTGTIGFLMDCETTGVEPLLGHVQYKKLAGGGTVTLVNRLVRRALERLGYLGSTLDAIVSHVETTGGFSGSPLRPEHLPVFDTAIPCGVDGRYLSVDAHLEMMAAVQPFLSGAISKTVNMPRGTTPEDVAATYMKGWKLGLKAVAIYRDGSKESQPVSTKQGEVKDAAKQLAEVMSLAPEPDLSRVMKIMGEMASQSPDVNPVFKHTQRKLPKERRGFTWALKLDDHKIYIRSGEYDDGSLGEVFVDIAKEGSTLGGLYGMWAKAVSLGLQYGVPLAEFIETFIHTKFEPNGGVKNHPTIKRSTSLVDLTMRVLGVKYAGRKDLQHVQEDALEFGEIPPTHLDAAAYAAPARSYVSDAPLCPVCGTLTQRNGACHRCPQCGESLGCS